ncbi:hypothetical protein D3C71_2039290 [compost metagenome]
MMAAMGPSRRTRPWKEDMRTTTTLSTPRHIRSGIGKVASYRPGLSVADDAPGRPFSPSLCPLSQASDEAAPTT